VKGEGEAEVTAQVRVLVKKQHSGTLFGCYERRAYSCRPAAGYNDIGMQILLVKLAWGRFNIDFAQSGDMT
jgi:hypothetical protein